MDSLLNFCFNDQPRQLDARLYKYFYLVTQVQNSHLNKRGSIDISADIHLLQCTIFN